MNENTGAAQSDNFIIWFSRQFIEYKVSIHAAHVAFFILASFIPFLMFLVTLLQYTPLTPYFVMDTASSFVPAGLSGFINNIFKESYSAASGTLLSLTVIGTLWAGSKGFAGIAYGLDSIYEVKKSRNFFICRLESVFYTIAFTVIIITSLIILVYGNQIVLFLTRHFPFSSYVNIIVFWLRSAIYFLILTVYFLCMFRYVPNHKSTFRSELPGAGLSAFFWIAFSYLYSLYIDSYGNSLSVYGSLTSLVLMMMWLYFCINIIFIGAMTNRYLKQYEKLCLFSSIWELIQAAMRSRENKKK